METITKFFKEEKDYLFRRGEAKGLEQGLEKGIEQGIESKSYEVVENLLLDFGFTDEQAARASQTSIDFVKKVRQDMENRQ